MFTLVQYDCGPIVNDYCLVFSLHLQKSESGLYFDKLDGWFWIISVLLKFDLSNVELNFYFNLF